MIRHIKNNMYVQVCDIDFILKNEHLLTEEISSELIDIRYNLGKRAKPTDFVVINDGEHGTELYILFSFFDNFVDYDMYIDKTIDEIKTEIDLVISKIRQTEIRYNNTGHEKAKVTCLSNNEYLFKKVYDLNNIIEYKTGKAKFHIPGEEQDRIAAAQKSIHLI